MMRARLFCLAVLGFFLPLTARAQQPDSLGWKRSLVFTLSGSQAGFHNWKQGGVNTFSATAALDGSWMRTGAVWKRKHTFTLALGALKQEGTDVRKSEDKILYQGSLQAVTDGAWKPTLGFGIQTQFIAGFNYEKNPFGDGRTPPVKVSDFLAPAYITQALGITYDPDSWFVVRMGLGAKETVVLLRRLRTLYGVSPDAAVRFELGLESRTEIDREVAKNIRWKSSAAFFAAFNKPELPDALWENDLFMQVNSWLTTRLTWVVYYDRDVSRKLQLKEVLSLGVAFRFI